MVSHCDPGKHCDPGTHHTTFETAVSIGVCDVFDY